MKTTRRQRVISLRVTAECYRRVKGLSSTRKKEGGDGSTLKTGANGKSVDACEDGQTEKKSRRAPAALGWIRRAFPQRHGRFVQDVDSQSKSRKPQIAKERHLEDFGELPVRKIIDPFASGPVVAEFPKKSAGQSR